MSEYVGVAAGFRQFASGVRQMVRGLTTEGLEELQAIEDGDTCEAGWGFDVHFDVVCGRHLHHVGDHRATCEGNNGALATITWENA